MAKGKLLDEIRRQRENALEKLADIMPGYKGYKEKEMRREADRLLRQTLVRRLEEQWRRLPDLEKKMLSRGKISYLDEAETVVNRLQTLIDKVKGATTGYSGLFDAMRVKERELDSLYDFDLALLKRVDDLKAAMAQLQEAIERGSPSLEEAIERLQDMTSGLNNLWDRREEVILGRAGEEIGAEPPPERETEPIPEERTSDEGSAETHPE
jgi:DNA repair ATPase RecN